MDAKRKEMSLDHKKIIVDLTNDGYSNCKIRKILGLNCSTVLKLIKHFKSNGLLENSRRSGRPKKTDDHGDRQILSVLKSNRRKCLNEVTASYNEQTPVKLSKETVKRRLKFYGCKLRVVEKKLSIPKLTVWRGGPGIRQDYI